VESEGGWQSQIRINDRPRRLGVFDEEEDAAHAYDDAARVLWGAEARVNFPLPGELPSAAAPVPPAELALGGTGPAARLPGKPADVTAVRNDDGSVTLSWRCANAAASAGVTFSISRKLPGQREFLRIGTAGGSTAQCRRMSFTDATVPTAVITAEGAGAEYIVQGSRGMAPGEASDVVVVTFDAGGAVVMPQSSAALAA
jgi:hypothetical protein